MAAATREQDLVKTVIRFSVATLTLLTAGALAGCGQPGDLYLPDKPGEVVTRAAATPPAESTTAPSSPQTADSQPAPPSPAPEVAAPEGTPEADKSKKDKSAAPPPPK
jgi:predicted small lipoprotein YifL